LFAATNPNAPILTLCYFRHLPDLLAGCGLLASLPAFFAGHSGELPTCVSLAATFAVGPMVVALAVIARAAMKPDQ
jgi:hypothetical protein